MAIATMNGRKNISEKRHIIVKLWLIQFIIIMIIMIHIGWDMLWVLESLFHPSIKTTYELI